MQQRRQLLRQRQVGVAGPPRHSVCRRLPRLAAEACASKRQHPSHVPLPLAAPTTQQPPLAVPCLQAWASERRRKMLGRRTALPRGRAWRQQMTTPLSTCWTTDGMDGTPAWPGLQQRLLGHRAGGQHWCELCAPPQCSLWLALLTLVVLFQEKRKDREWNTHTVGAVLQRRRQDGGTGWVGDSKEGHTGRQGGVGGAPRAHTPRSMLVVIRARLGCKTGLEVGMCLLGAV